jgi:bisphosphoglycerate-independent phosphoglycerate mutase (AlkP superfamily)
VYNCDFNVKSQAVKYMSRLSLSQEKALQVTIKTRKRYYARDRDREANDTLSDFFRLMVSRDLNF